MTNEQQIAYDLTVENHERAMQMLDKQVPPAVAEFVAGERPQLLEKIEQQAREIESLNTRFGMACKDLAAIDAALDLPVRDYASTNREKLDAIAALKARSGGVVLYTCIGKGGQYEHIGLSDGAGMSKGELRQVYRCTSTGRVFHRECVDFSVRMERLNQQPASGGDKAHKITVIGDSITWLTAVDGGDLEPLSALRALGLVQSQAEPASAGDQCECGGNPHTTQCLYEHFLAYSGLTDQPLLRYAYFHGAGADCEQPASVGDDAEQAAFESWLDRVRPGGDVDSVHAQWLESSDYADIFDQAYDRDAEQLTAEALGTGAGINPKAASVDDIFLTESAGGVDERAALQEAATSLETIASLAGRDDFMIDLADVRSYASSRASVARAALSANHSEQVRDGYVQVPKGQLDIVLNGLPSIDKTRVMQKLRVMLHHAAAPSAGQKEQGE